jgi:Fibronectin type III domain
MKLPAALRLATICFVLASTAGYSHAQTARVVSRARNVPTAAPVVLAAGSAPTAPTNLTVTAISNRQVALSWTASASASGAAITYSIQRCQGGACTTLAPVATTTYTDPGLTPETTYTYQVVATAGGQNSGTSNLFTVTTTRYTCLLLPTRIGCMDFGPDRQPNINSFYSTEGAFSYFNQVKSIYNGASGSTTVSADLASLNFLNGMQVTVGTNIQAGSPGTTTVTSGAVPTLTANGAGQATQNMLYGGTFLVSGMYPLLVTGADKMASTGAFGTFFDLRVKEGADIQNFKSGTNVNVTSPPSHTSVQIEGYVQYNSTNLAPGTSHYAGALFFGGSYGYSFMSHGYARDYGFGNNVNHGIGQISAGILISGVATIAVSRAFGPSQTYIDSTTTTQTTVNNFKSWSFGITYQAPAAK